MNTNLFRVIQSNQPTDLVAKHRRVQLVPVMIGERMQRKIRMHIVRYASRNHMAINEIKFIFSFPSLSFPSSCPFPSYPL
jgi:hypothetical protein